MILSSVFQWQLLCQLQQTLPKPQIPDGLCEEQSPLTSVSGLLKFRTCCGSLDGAKELCIRVSKPPTIACLGYDLYCTQSHWSFHHKPYLSPFILFEGRCSSPGTTISLDGFVKIANLLGYRDLLWIKRGWAIAIQPCGFPWQAHQPGSLPSGMHLIWPLNCMYWHLSLAFFF